MLSKAGLLLLAVAVFQASAQYVEPEFIEDVQKREAENPSNRIVSGWTALPGQHPHQAALRMVDAIGTVTACGGSIVHHEWVLTAAHCTATRVTIIVRGGVVSLTTPEYIYESHEWYNYPTYDNNDVSTVQPNDIALLKLPRRFTYTDNLKPIRIQSSADAFRNYDNEVVHTSGHGRTWTLGATTEVLQWVYMRAISNPTCRLTFGDSIITENAICARWFNVTSQSTCQGDSGGPLVHVDSDGIETLIGVTSFVAGGDWGCHSGLPAGFIRPGPFHSWYKLVTGIDFENLVEEDEEDTTDPPAPEDEDESESDEGSGENDSSGEDDSSDEDSSDSNDDSDDEVSQILKKLQVNVKVKIVLNKYNKYKKEVHKEKEIRH